MLYFSPGASHPGPRSGILAAGVPHPQGKFPEGSMMRKTLLRVLRVSSKKYVGTANLPTARAGISQHWPHTEGV